MAFSVLEHGARFVFFFTSGTVSWTTGLHATQIDYNEDSVNTIVAALRASIAGVTVKPWTTNDSLTEIIVYDERDETAPVYRPVITAVAGNNAGERTDKASAVVVTLRTNRRGRSGRGRMYIGGQAEGQMSSGTWAPTHITNVETLVTAIMGAFNANGWVPVIKSTQQNHVHLNPAVAYAITSWECRNNIPGSQDRRNHRP